MLPREIVTSGRPSGSRIDPECPDPTRGDRRPALIVSAKTPVVVSATTSGRPVRCATDYRCTSIYRSIDRYADRDSSDGTTRTSARDRTRAAARYARSDTDVAAELSANKGLCATGTREITTAVGFRQPSLSRSFARKEVLFADSLDRTVSRLCARRRADASARVDRRYGSTSSRVHDVTCVGAATISQLCSAVPRNETLDSRVFGRIGRAWVSGISRSLLGVADRAGSVVERPLDMTTDLAFGPVEARSPGQRDRAARPAPARPMRLHPPLYEVSFVVLRAENGDTPPRTVFELGGDPQIGLSPCSVTRWMTRG
jgi:AcrR family transcriptional regulator